MAGDAIIKNSNCYIHPDKEATTTCTKCYEPICDICKMNTIFETICPSCLKKMKRIKYVKFLIIFLMTLICISSALVFANSHKKPFSYGRYAIEIHELQTYLKNEPCDRSKTVKLGELLYNAGDYRGALNLCDKFNSQCGNYLRLNWISYSSHSKLSEFDEAIKDVTQLIEDDPYDTDYWWWRAEIYEEIGKYEEAIADYRQTIALQPNVRDIPFKLSSVLEKAGKGCEAAFPIEQFLFYYPEFRSYAKVQNRLKSIYSDVHCRQFYSNGKAIIHFNPRERIIRVCVKINGQIISNFFLDTGANLVILSDTFAQKLNIEKNIGRSILLQTAGGMKTATLSTADKIEVGGTTAQRVDIAIVSASDLGENIDGLLGMSFLSRFDMSIDNTNGTVILTTKNSQ